MLIVVNTQFVERLVQTVASLGDVATDPQIRDGYVKAMLASQKMLPKREQNKAVYTTASVAYGWAGAVW